MRLSENEVHALILITRSQEPVHPHALQKELSLLKGSISRIITGLQDIGLVERTGGEILLASTPPADAFKRLYYSHYLQGFRSLGIGSRSMQGKAYLYSFNYIIWPELKNFVTTLREFQVLRLVPRDALLIRSYEKNVLFRSLRQQDATLTSFSAYADYGIKLGLRDNYYTLPKRELSIGEIFIHSLDSTEDYRQRLFCILFYLKNRDELKGVRHPMMKSIRAVLRGEHIKGYPTVEEIEEQAELYGINDIEP